MHVLLFPFLSKNFAVLKTDLLHVLAFDIVISQSNTFSTAVVQSVLERLNLKKVCQEKSTACSGWQM